MALEIAVGRQKRVINQGACYLVANQDRQIQWPSDKSLYNADTRLVSSGLIVADGQRWDIMSSDNLAKYSTLVF